MADEVRVSWPDKKLEVQAVMEQLGRVSATTTPITSPVQALTASPQNQYHRVSGHGPFSATADSSSHADPLRSLNASGHGTGTALGQFPGACC